MYICLHTLEQIVRAAGDLALSYFNRLNTVTIQQKSPRDFVTDADIAVESFLKQSLGQHYPQFGFWGEESGHSANQINRWIVDPIDGTHSFAKGQYYWSISVALEIEQQIVAGIVYAPALNDCYSAQKGCGASKNGRVIQVSTEECLENAMIGTGFACLRSYCSDNNLARFARIAQRTTGQRRFGSAAMDLCLVADGQLDAFWEQALQLYDVAAGALIAQEAGATITDFRGQAGIFPQQILASNGKLLAQLLPLM
jgi:myo-inositol-1(or 4)-monophosphatase